MVIHEVEGELVYANVDGPDTYSDSDVGLDGGLVQTSCRENGELVRVRRPHRRRRRQR
jgi:hypothetical protein